MFTQFSKIFVNNFSESLSFSPLQLTEHWQQFKFAFISKFDLLWQRNRFSSFSTFSNFPHIPIYPSDQRTVFKFSSFRFPPYMGPLGSTDNFVTKFGDSLKKFTHFLWNFHTFHNLCQQFEWITLIFTIVAQESKLKYIQSQFGEKMPWPGFEPGLLRPQRRVLTTRRSRRLLLEPLLCQDIHFSGSKLTLTFGPGATPGACHLPLPPLARVGIGRVRLRRRVSTASEFSWCSGYHICLTHRRSPVRSRAKTILKHFWDTTQFKLTISAKVGFNLVLSKLCYQESQLN